MLNRYRNKRVLLDYTIMFDPDDAWKSLLDFEQDLTDFFAAHGLEARIIKTIDGQVGRRIFELQRLDRMTLETNQHNKPLTMKNIAPTPTPGALKKMTKGFVK